MRLLALVFALVTFTAPPRTVGLALIHTFAGCHVWQSGGRTLGARATLTLERGDRIQLRISCPMNFEIEQLRGPKLALGDPTFHTGTLRTIVFGRKGVYVLRATNLETSEQVGLQTVGPDNAPTLTIRVS